MGYMRPADTMLMKRIKTSVGVLLVFVGMSFHLVAGILMVRKPGKDYRHSLDRKPPVGEWWTAMVFVFIQVYVYLC